MNRYYLPLPTSPIQITVDDTKITTYDWFNRIKRR